MKIIQLKMQNFRQYLGNVTIDFSVDENNITLITGENGKGKTGIYRALMFALFGMEYIQQDNKNDQIILGNRFLLDKDNAVNTSVSVKFEYNNKNY